MFRSLALVFGFEHRGFIKTGIQDDVIPEEDEDEEEEEIDEEEEEDEEKEIEEEEEEDVEEDVDEDEREKQRIESERNEKMKDILDKNDNETSGNKKLSKIQVKLRKKKGRNKIKLRRDSWVVDTQMGQFDSLVLQAEKRERRMARDDSDLQMLLERESNRDRKISTTR